MHVKDADRKRSQLQASMSKCRALRAPPSCAPPSYGAPRRRIESSLLSHLSPPRLHAPRVQPVADAGMHNLQSAAHSMGDALLHAVNEDVATVS